MSLWRRAEQLSQWLRSSKAWLRLQGHPCFFSHCQGLWHTQLQRTSPLAWLSPAQAPHPHPQPGRNCLDTGGSAPVLTNGVPQTHFHFLSQNHPFCPDFCPEIGHKEDLTWLVFLLSSSQGHVRQDEWGT